jgi:tetratricopeptide (TPR) repeat protein
MDWKRARWPLVMGLLIAAAAMQFGKSQLASEPPQPDDLSTIDGEVVKLIRKATAAVKQKPNDLDRWLLLGKVYEANSLHDVANETYRFVLERNPAHAEAWFRDAVCHERLGDLDAAIASMEKSIEHRPEFAAARWRQSMWLTDVGQIEKAATRADEATKLAAQDSSAWFAKVKVLLAQRKNEEAIQLIGEQNLEATRNGTYAKFLLGTAYRQMGQLEKAEGLLGQATNFRPAWRDDWTRELAKLHTGLTKLQSVGGNLVKQGKFTEAIPILEKVVAADPRESRGWNLLGLCYMRLQQYDQSLATFERSLSVNPEHYGSNVNYASAAMAAAVDGESIDLDVAFARASKAVELRPNSAGAHEVVARILKLLHRPDEAIVSFDRAFELDARVPARAVEASLLEMQLGNWTAAEVRLEALLKSLGPSSLVLSQLSRVKLELNKPDEAKQLAQQAKTSPNCAPAEARLADSVLRALDSESSP